MFVKSCAGAPSFHVADRCPFFRLNREKTALAIGVDRDQPPHGIQDVDDFGCIPGKGMDGNDREEHVISSAQNVPIGRQVAGDVNIMISLKFLVSKRAGWCAVSRDG